MQNPPKAPQLPLPTLCTHLGLGEGDLPFPGLQPLPCTGRQQLGPFCAGISCSCSCRAAGKQSIAFCSSTPARTRSPQPHAQARPAWQLESPHTPWTRQREPGLRSGLHPSPPRLPVQWQELPLPVAEEGLEQVLTLWLLQCVTVAWFSEREGRRAVSALQPHSHCSRGGHTELASQPRSCTRRTLFCTGCLHPSPSPPPAWASLRVLGDANWLHPPVSGHRKAGMLGALLLAVPAGCLLGTGALAALLVADVLVYLVDSPVPAHTAEGRVAGNNRDRSSFMSARGEVWGVSPISFQAAVASLGRNGPEPAMPEG